MSHMKIVIDARESGTTTGRYVDKLVEYLHKLQPKHEFTILAHEHRLEFFKKIAPKFKVVETKYKEFTFSEQIDLLKQIKKLKADLVHFAIVQQPVFYRGKTVTTMHDLTTARFRNPAKNPVVFWLKQQVYKWVNIRAAHKSDAILVPTEFVKDDVARFTRTNSRKITVTYEAADKIEAAPEPVEELIDKDFIMYVGRPQPHKNLGRLIEAFVKLKPDHPNLKLVLVGKKDLTYRKLALKSKLKAKDIVFTGFVSEGELRWLYEHAQAYVFPSLSEGFGLPPLEAMMHSCPVVSSNATCLPEVNGDAAEYFDPLSVDEMSAAINKVISSEKRRKELIVLGKKQASKYSWQRMAEQTLEVYNQTLNSLNN